MSTKIKNLTCIVCPSGCDLKCELDENGNILSITGNGCKRGVKYAEQELTHPMRTLTTTVTAVIDGKHIMIPVRTSREIPRERLFEAMELVRKIKVTEPVALGESIVVDFIDRGTNLVACKNVPDTVR